MITEEWTKRNKELLKKINKFRDNFTCKCNCWEWKKWKYCTHLRNAIGKIFESEIEVQIGELAE